MRLTKRQRDKLKNKFGGRCAYCGELLPDRWHADHLEPVERKLKYVQDKGLVSTGEMYNPEADNIDNLMPACPSCNIDKHSYPLEFWRKLIQNSANVLTRDNTTYRRAKRYGLVSETGAPVVFYFERMHGGEKT